MYGMRERVDSNDIKLLDDYFHGLIDDENEELKILKSKIDLLVQQDNISRDAGEKLTALQDEIVALYKKEGEQNVVE